MCFWPIVEVELEDPPKKKKKEEKSDYVLVSDQLNLQPIVSTMFLGALVLSIYTPTSIFANFRRPAIQTHLLGRPGRHVMTADF